MDCKEGLKSSGCVNTNAIRSALTELQVRYRDNFDSISIEEKKEHRAFLKEVIDIAKAIEKDTSKSMDQNDVDSTVFRMVGHFPVDAAGLPMIPTKEDVEVGINQVLNQNLLGRRHVLSPETHPSVSIESVVREDNFHHILEGPSSQNYLTNEMEVYVKLGNSDQYNYLLQQISQGRGSFSIPCWTVSRQRVMYNFNFSSPRRDTRTRAAYREIGTLITRLRQVDAQLRTIGAVPGRGGIPVLSDKLIQKEDFDVYVESFVDRIKAKPRAGAMGANTAKPSSDMSNVNTTNDKETLHSWLCTRTRVDRRKHQETLEPLVDERIDILLKLSQIDPDEFPFVVERDFK